MPESAALTTTFHALRDRVDGKIPHPAPIPKDAPETFTDAISATILPRILTLTASDGSRVDVTVRNRRIIGVEAVEPAELWQGRIALTDAGCNAQPEEFAHPLARAILAVSGRGAIQVRTHLLDGQAPAIALAGYPVARLLEDIEAMRGDSTTNPVRDFREAWSGHPRAWSGKEAGIDVPEGSAVKFDWMTARLSEWSTATSDTTDIQFVMTGGDAPIALALVAMGGEFCIVACNAPGEFARLEADLLTLHDQSGGV